METPGHGRSILESSAVRVRVRVRLTLSPSVTLDVALVGDTQDHFHSYQVYTLKHEFVWATVVMAPTWSFLFRLSQHHLSALGGSAKVAPDGDGNVRPAVHVSPHSDTTQACPGGVHLDLRELESHRRYCRDSQSRIMGCQWCLAVLSWQLEPLRRIQQNAASIFKVCVILDPEHRSAQNLNGAL